MVAHAYYSYTFSPQSDVIFRVCRFVDDIVAVLEKECTLSEKTVETIHVGVVLVNLSEVQQFSKERAATVSKSC